MCRNISNHRKTIWGISISTEVYVDDDDRKQREKPSEIAQIASAFLEPEDLQRMGVAENENSDQTAVAATADGDHDRDHDRDVNGIPRSPTPGSPCPEDLPSQPHYPQSTNAPLVRVNSINDGEQKNISSPPSPHGDDASNASSCSKR